jgi:DNA-binding MarR family transcriptional regulator
MELSIWELCDDLPTEVAAAESSPTACRHTGNRPGAGRGRDLGRDPAAPAAARRLEISAANLPVSFLARRPWRGSAMNPAELKEFYALALAVRRLFHKLAHGAAALHADSDISVGMRAVLESVIDGGPQTVPQMARIRPVTRQHIQTLVNALIEGGYVDMAENPRHKRSQLVKATKKGERAFAAMRARENEAFRRARIALSAEDLHKARKVLQSLTETFDGDQWRAGLSRSPKAKEK